MTSIKNSKMSHLQNYKNYVYIYKSYTQNLTNILFKDDYENDFILNELKYMKPNR